MTYLTTILTILIVILLTTIFIMQKQIRENKAEIKRLEKEMTQCAILGAGLAGYNERMKEQKEKFKEQILQMFQQKEKIAHSEMAGKLDISRPSIIRYLDELEKEGKVKQVGKTGKNVYYQVC